MRVLSLFSGVGGMDLGLERAGMTVAGMCEIDKHARSVLARHWPTVPLWEDVTSLEVCACNGLSEHMVACGTRRESDVVQQGIASGRCHDCGGVVRGRVDLVAGGSPCQDLSVAGKRKGLDGARSGLFWHQCRIADSVAAGWVLWENVAGALTSNDGADFAAVLWGITGAYPGVPDGGWRSAGVIVGPKRWAVWRLLDAQWFGVAQRRRRVFVVGGPRGDCRPEVLLERSCLPGDSSPSREAWAGSADESGDGVAEGGWRLFDNYQHAGFRPGSGTLRTKLGGNDHLVARDVSVFRMQAFGQYAEDQVASLIKARDHKDSTDLVVSFAWHKGFSEIADQPDGPVHTLTHKPPGVAMSLRQKFDGSTFLTEVHPPLLADGGAGREPTAFIDNSTVRRLTPRECERLMGWPDDWTRYRADGTEQADTHRYKQCGNGVVSNVAEWIGRRMMLRDND